MTGNRARRTERSGGGTWLVLSRDISDSVRIDGEPSVPAGMVLDMETGLVLGVAAGTTESEAIAQAFRMGLTKPAGDLPPGPPDEVLCPTELEGQIIELLALVHGDRLPAVKPIEPPAEAEDIFDSFVGHMSGRPQPTQPPSPSDWVLLYGRALDFYRAGPCTRWHDGTVLALQTNIESTDGGWAAVVLGSSGIQHGLVIYPGG